MGWCEWRSKVNDTAKVADSESDLPEKTGPKLREDVWLKVELMLIERWPNAHIVASVVDEFGICERTGWSYIKRVKDAWRDASAATLEERRAQFEAELLRDAAEARRSGDYKAVSSFARVRADVAGLRAPRKIEITGEITPVQALTPEQRQAEIDRLLSKRKGEE